MFGAQPILIVEDEFLIALSLADVVTELDGHVVGPVVSVSGALAILDSRPVAGAILDARLLDRDITPVALRLAQAGIPFVMHTATGLPPEVARRLPDAPVLLKPVPPLVVAQRLWAEMHNKARVAGRPSREEMLLVNSSETDSPTPSLRPII